MVGGEKHINPHYNIKAEKMTRKEILEKTIDFDDAINRIVRLEKENAELKTLIKSEHELEAQIEKMKSDVKGNIKWADQNKNDQMWQKLVKMYNQWEMKENEMS